MYRVHDNVTRFFRFVCTSMNNKWIKKTNKSFETIVYYLLFIYIYTCLFWIKKKITLQSKQENKETKKAKENERKRIPIKRGILTIFWKDTCPFAISQESFLTLTTDTTLLKEIRCITLKSRLIFQGKLGIFFFYKEV